MKAQIKPALLGLVTAAAIALTATSYAQSNPPAPSAPDSHVDRNLVGKVTAKSDTSLTVGSRTVLLNASTTFARNGTAIGSADVKVGDDVNIATTDDGQVALSVSVTSSS